MIGERDRLGANPEYSQLILDRFPKTEYAFWRAMNIHASNKPPVEFRFLEPSFTNKLSLRS